MLNVCKTCFFWLRQLRRVRQSLDVESVGLCFWRVVGRLLQLSCEESQTRCSLFWMLQHVWSLGLSSTVLARSVTANAWWPALGDGSWEAAVQARRDGPWLPVGPGSQNRYVADYCVCLCHQRLWSVRPHQMSVSRVHHNTFESRCFFCRRTNSLEFTARWSAWSSFLCRTWKHIYSLGITERYISGD